ncbi:MAG: hypothetical protein BWY83_00308 [bacterium ADurb.Bin478]|nr:MAG: hypothetical protein BWY83_00308 [bacterium ADurb.Bin478]
MTNRIFQSPTKLLFYASCAGLIFSWALAQTVQAHSPGTAGQTAVHDTLKQMALLQQLQWLQQEIISRPDQPLLRQRWVAAAVDSSGQKLYAVGVGKPSSSFKSPLAAQQAAERAAFLDACRWLTYLQAWRRDYRRPPFGDLVGQAPAAQVIYKIVTLDQTIVLVETKP